MLDHLPARGICNLVCALDERASWFRAKGELYLAAINLRLVLHPLFRRLNTSNAITIRLYLLPQELIQSFRLILRVPRKLEVCTILRSRTVQLILWKLVLAFSEPSGLAHVDG
jgi:hypothetical protein